MGLCYYVYYFAVGYKYHLISYGNEGKLKLVSYLFIFISSFLALAEGLDFPHSYMSNVA